MNQIGFVVRIECWVCSDGLKELKLLCVKGSPKEEAVELETGP